MAKKTESEVEIGTKIRRNSVQPEVSFLFGMDLRRVNGSTIHSRNLVKAVESAGVKAQVVSFDSMHWSNGVWLFKAPFAARSKTVFLRSGFAFLPLLFLKILGKSVFVNVASLRQFECPWWQKPFIALFEALAVRFADGVATISPQLAAYARANGARRVFVYPLCVDFARLSAAKPQPPPAKRNAKGNAKKFVLGYAGSKYEKQDQLRLLLDALREIRGENENIELRVYGKTALPGEQADQTDSRVTRVKYFGLVEPKKMPGILKSLDLFVLPRSHNNSVDVATPIKLVEAMACGTPILCTNVGGCAWLLRDGENALVCDASAAGLARGIERAARLKRGELKALGERARRDAAESDLRVVGPKLANFLFK